MRPEEFRQLEIVLPESPGVYRYYDRSELLLYVGKAKNLRKRVSSYFRPDLQREGRLRMMIDRIARIDFTLTETEMDALLLENSLIKTYQPRYNIRLKDDKSYPYLVIRNEHFPRIFPTRRLLRDGSTYLGPFPSVLAMRTMLELVRRIYPLRTCSLPLTPLSIARGKFRACLEYQIGNCLAPCEGRQSEESYLEQIDAIRLILKGQYQKAAALLRDEMKQHAADLRFEQAARVKKKMELLEQYQAKSSVVHHDITETDVFSVAMKDDTAVVNFLHMQQGRIVISHNLEIARRLDEDEATLLLYGIVELRNRYSSESKRLLLNRAVEGLPADLDIQVPRQGEKKKIVELSWKNAMYFLSDLIR
ncbi:MAG: excinuclease ABC subunit C, partial [Bacteroidetes bacterium]|nr:excinuclease ABC subunit C [Bacteroidota bacterium]